MIGPPLGVLATLFSDRLVCYRFCSKLCDLQAGSSACRICSLNTPQRWLPKADVTSSGTSSAPLPLPSIAASSLSPTLQTPEPGFAWERRSVAVWELVCRACTTGSGGGQQSPPPVAGNTIHLSKVSAFCLYDLIGQWSPERSLPLLSSPQENSGPASTEPSSFLS